MQIEGALPRVALAAATILAVSGLVWWTTDRESQPDAQEFVTIQAAPLPKIGSGTGVLALAEERILETIGEPGTRVRDLRIVDQERLIVCGERIDRGSASARRFVWLSQLRQVVTDDGGQDFAILVHVCNPPPSPDRFRAGGAESRRLD